MEKVLTTNNGESNWSKLSTFGLHNRRSILGFNSYGGRNGHIYLVDKVSGMKVLFMAGQKPRSERETRAIKVPGKRGRPAMFGPIQAKEPGKRGRPAQYSHPIMFREPLKRGRKPLTVEQRAAREAIKAELAGLVFFGPARKRGPKPKDASETLNAGTQSAPNGGKRGRLSEKERIAAANVGDRVKANGGGYWQIIAKGLPSYIAA
jgi:hypothetical protein